MPPDASSKPLLARTLGKGPGGRLFPASGLALPRFAHNWPLTRATHTRKRRLHRVRAASTIRANNCPSGQTDAGICYPDMVANDRPASGQAAASRRSSWVSPRPAWAAMAASRSPSVSATDPKLGEARVRLAPRSPRPRTPLSGCCPYGPGSARISMSTHLEQSVRRESPPRRIQAGVSP